MSNSSQIVIALAWQWVGCHFLCVGEYDHAVLAGMVSITIAALAWGPAQPGARIARDRGEAGDEDAAEGRT